MTPYIVQKPCLKLMYTCLIKVPEVTGQVVAAVKITAGQVVAAVKITGHALNFVK